MFRFRVEPQWEGLLKPSLGKGSSYGESPCFFSPLPIHPAGFQPSLHTSALSWCCVGQPNGSEEQKPFKAAHPTRVTCWVTCIVVIWRLSFQKGLPPQQLGQSCTVFSCCCFLDRCVPAARSARMCTRVHACDWITDRCSTAIWI